MRIHSCFHLIATSLGMFRRSVYFVIIFLEHSSQESPECQSLSPESMKCNDKQFRLRQSAGTVTGPCAQVSPFLPTPLCAISSAASAPTTPWWGRGSIAAGISISFYPSSGITSSSLHPLRRENSGITSSSLSPRNDSQTTQQILQWNSHLIPRAR